MISERKVRATLKPAVRPALNLCCQVANHAFGRRRRGEPTQLVRALMPRSAASRSPSSRLKLYCGLPNDLLRVVMKSLGGKRPLSFILWTAKVAAMPVRHYHSNFETVSGAAGMRQDFGKLWIDGIGFMRDGRRLRDGREKADDKRLYRDRPR
jgi:hypothetical protein